jgi:hypothetical protein
VSDLVEIARATARLNLPFLLAGGHAVIIHGHARVTFDLDMIIRRQDQEAWRSLVAALGYTPYRQGPTFLQFNPLDETRQGLDLMFMAEETFNAMRAEAVTIRQQNVEIQVVSLRHLLALKCHAIRHTHAGRIVKDADDVIQLIQANRLDINERSWREWLLKYGTEDFYTKLQRACGPEPGR